MVTLRSQRFVPETFLIRIVFVHILNGIWAGPHRIKEPNLNLKLFKRFLHTHIYQKKKEYWNIKSKSKILKARVCLLSLFLFADKDRKSASGCTFLCILKLSFLPIKGNIEKKKKGEQWIENREKKMGFSKGQRNMLPTLSPFPRVAPQTSN